ncbi:MAG: lysylphosphatidylglycerol synthase transmembrane domain-containing protein [Candidatus Pacearchaeota archaeon]
MRLAASICVGVVLLIAVLRWVGLKAILKVMNQLNPVWLAPAIALNLTVPVFRAERWKLLLNPLDSISLRRLIPIVILGSVANMIMPARTGEFLRVFLIRGEGNVRFTSGLSSIFVERVLDVLALLGLSVAAMAAARVNMPAMFLNALKLVAALFMALIVLILFMAKRKSLVFAAFRVVKKVFPKRIQDRLTGQVELAVKGVEALNEEPKTIFLVSLLTVAIWAAPAASTILLFKAFSVEMSMSTVTLGYALHSLSFAIPAPPGYAGTFEIYWALIYSNLGMGFEEALAMGLAVHTVSFFTTTALGSIALLTINLRKLIEVYKKAYERIFKFKDKKYIFPFNQ